MIIAGRSVQSLVKTLLDICLLRASPADLPASAALLVLALAAYFVIGLMILLPGADSAGTALMQAIADIVLLVGLVHLALRLRGAPERFNQTLAALGGTGAMLALVAWPLIVSLHGPVGEVAALPSLLLLALFLWSITVIGHILRHSLSLPLAGGVLVASVYVAVSMLLFAALFNGSP